MTVSQHKNEILWEPAGPHEAVAEAIAILHQKYRK